MFWVIYLMRKGGRIKDTTHRVKKEVPHVIDGCAYVWVEDGIHVRDSPDQKLFFFKKKRKIKMLSQIQIIRKEKDRKDHNI